MIINIRTVGRIFFPFHFWCLYGVTETLKGTPIFQYSLKRVDVLFPLFLLFPFQPKKSVEYKIMWQYTSRWRTNIKKKFNAFSFCGFFYIFLVFSEWNAMLRIKYWSNFYLFFYPYFFSLFPAKRVVMVILRIFDASLLFEFFSTLSAFLKKSFVMSNWQIILYLERIGNKTLEGDF